MSPGPLALDLDKLQQVVQTAVGSVSQGVFEHFMLRAVARADFRDDDHLMVALTAGATDECFAVELVDAERGDTSAVRVQGVRYAKADFRRWAGMLWRAWLKARGPQDAEGRSADAAV